MNLPVADVKKLRELTGAGMMKCKEALKETGGDIEGAIDFLRKKGLAATQKKQSRIAAEGAVVALVEGHKGVIVEVNCETDFVSKGDDFQNFAQGMAKSVLNEWPTDLEEFKNSKSDEINELTLKCGEKVDIRRCQMIETEGNLGYYNHGGKIGVLVEASGGSGEMLKDVAMHIAAASPRFVSADQIDEEFKNKEAEIYAAQLREEGRPEHLIEKIVQGKLGKMAKEICLLEQPFVKDPEQRIKKFIGDVQVKQFVKFNLGEGIEKKMDNLAEEVAKMTGRQ